MWGARNGLAEAQEAIKGLEIRLARLAEEVQSSLRRLEIRKAREVARTAALAEATDKYKRAAERARKSGVTGGGDDGTDDDAFWDLFEHRRQRVAAPGEP